MQPSTETSTLDTLTLAVQWGGRTEGRQVAAHTRQMTVQLQQRQQWKGVLAVEDRAGCGQSSCVAR